MSNVYDNVGIRGGGRSAAKGGEADAIAVPISSTGGGSGRNEENDFFFPVTPEQLIVLNLAEVAAGE